MTKKNIEKISLLKEKIKDWNTLKDDELFQLIKEFEKMPRLAVSTCYNSLFNDAKLAENLLNIYESHKENSKLTVLLVSSIGNMIQRYHLSETKAIYEFMLDNAYKKNLGAYVALFLPKLKLFDQYEKKWQYIMQVKDMYPKKVAEHAFEILMDLFIDKIPIAYKAEVSAYFVNKAEKSNNDYGKQYYIQLANQLER
jgi:hypothetical protein